MSSLTPDLKPTILLTNDDGYNAIGFYPLLKALSADYHVVAVVPDGQRSWQSKTLTSKAPLTITPQPLQDFVVLTVNGTPADCVQLGLNHVLTSPPDLVVSGINSGANAGRSRVLSSGTVGAAMEAVLNGSKALAASLYLSMSDEVYRSINFTDPKNYGLFEPAAAIVTKLVARMLTATKTTTTQPLELISVNIPLEATTQTPIAVVSLAQDTYGSVFVQKEAAFVHGRSKLPVDQAEPNTDIGALKRGLVAITPIDLSLQEDKLLSAAQTLFAETA